MHERTHPDDCAHGLDRQPGTIGACGFFREIGDVATKVLIGQDDLHVAVATWREPELVQDIDCGGVRRVTSSLTRAPTAIDEVTGSMEDRERCEYLGDAC
jgi:hypothetical protein